MNGIAHSTLSLMLSQTHSSASGEMNIGHIALMYMHHERWEILTNEALVFVQTAGAAQAQQR